MEYIRILSLHHFDRKRRKFTSLAFKNSSNSGISVVSRECIRESGNRICPHIYRFYGRIASDPAIFWIFPFNELPDKCSLEPSLSDTGDECHYNLEGLTNSEASRKRTSL